MMLILTKTLMTMIPEESKHLVPWKMGEEGFVLGEGRAKQLKLIKENARMTRATLTGKTMNQKECEKEK